MSQTDRHRRVGYRDRSGLFCRRDRSRRAAAALALIVLALGCAADDERARIVAAIESAVEDAGEGRARAVAERISRDYRDAEGRDRRTLLALLSTRLDPGQRTYLRHRVASLEVDGERAESVLWVAIGSRPIGEDWSVDEVGAEAGELRLRWAKEGRTWRVIEASWRGLSLEELRRSAR